MKRFKLLCLLLLCSFGVYAQSFYVSAPIDPAYAPAGSNLFKVTLVNGSFISQPVGGCYSHDFFSLAMNKSGLYWLDQYYVYKADITGNTLSNCNLITTLPVISNALTIDNASKLYYATSSLYSVDTQTKQIKNLGYMNGFSPSGDIIFYKGQIYMASPQGIVKVDPNNPSSSYLYIPTSGNLIYGLVSVATSLHQNTVYALQYINAHQTNIVQIDIDNGKVVGVVGTLPYEVLDAASIVEDGEITGIQFDKVNIHQDCDHPTTGIAEVITEPHVESFTYTLSNTSTNLTNTAGTFTGLNAGTYNLTITSASDQFTTTVTVPSFSLRKPAYTYTVQNQACSTPGSITFQSADISDTYSVQSGTDVFPINHAFTGLMQGSYQFNIINGNGCKVDAVNVDLGRDKCTIQYAGVDVQQQCDALHKGVAQVLTNPHADQYTYTLNGISNNTGIFSNLDPGAYSIDIKSPEDEIQVPATVPDYKSTEPAVTYTMNNPACAAKGSVKFNMADNSGLYKLQLGSDVFPFDHVFDNLSAGNYHFVLLTQNNCIIEYYDVSLQYQPCPIVIDKIDATAECNVLGKGIITVTCEPIPETYTYTLNNSISNNTGVFNMLDPGPYQLTVSASGGGTPQTRTVLVPDFRLNKPLTVINKINPVCDLTGQIQLKVGNDASQYNVEFNSAIYRSDYIFRNLYAGQYHFSILKTTGCIVDTVGVNLTQETCSPVSFPNTFSPNSDGINDIFRPDPQSKATNYRLSIYNRYGALLFTTTELHTGWDGSYKGTGVPVGTYYWVAIFTNQDNKQEIQKGYVALIR